MKINKLTLLALIAVMIVLLAGDCIMYQKSKSMIKVIKQLNSIIEKQGGQIKKLVK